jgi:hypothetical protein
VKDFVTAAGEQRVNRCDMLNESLNGPKRLLHVVGVDRVSETTLSRKTKAPANLGRWPGLRYRGCRLDRSDAAQRGRSRVAKW